MSDRSIVPLTVPGLGQSLKMAVHDTGDRVVSKAIREHGHWEYYETLLLMKHLKYGDVFLDVGANIGYYSLIAAHRVGGEGRVIAVEPEAHNFQLLQKNRHLNGFESVIKTFQCALSNSNTSSTLYLSDHNYGDHRAFPGLDHQRQETVKSMVGDQLVGTQQVDFIKVDTQGAEFHVLSGLRDTIARNRAHLKLIVEFSPYGLRHSGVDGHQLLSLLDEFEFNYQIIDHHKDSLLPIDSQSLSDWISETDANPENEGFINLFLY